MRVLILGGTTEARELAALIAGEHEVITSLAGRTSAPRLPAGEVRVGGFGGPEGLARYLAEQRIDVLVDATHPFAARISANAAAMAVPTLILRRPGWVASPGDDWQRVASVADAAAALTGGRVFLTTGRQTIHAFAHRDDCWFLARSVEPPAPPMPRHLEVLLDRGPFTVEGERWLLAEHRIDVLVTKDSGGSDAKLAAARAEGVRVILVDRPPMPAAPAVSSAEAAAAWLRQQRSR
ncbi:precorrin-6A reductase [Actinoplanes cyaneus]|uniref:Precorrin-6A reductase n=1 Tax=Actinoplanes cyaneus TaxID=52696 RepID=A0A919ISC1_9ACTN|nr:cobalt-precorrin-6A reductase [Actinoplanes cyaneus]MCW2143723.1 precorrin-6A/cobalt-precorrin-6A reductase [Actinoplanes cyaneus]GID68683.1 precorrin-6A reductase [Actinoplanes cyaneus]